MSNTFGFYPKKHIYFFVGAIAIILLAATITLSNVMLLEQIPEGLISIIPILELFSVIAAVVVISIAWVGLKQSNQPMATPLIFGFTAVAGIHILRLLIPESTPETSTYFWLASRSFELLTMVLVMHRFSLLRANSRWLSLGPSVVGCLLLAVVFGLNVMPDANVAFFTKGYVLAISAAKLGLAYFFFFQSARRKNPTLLLLGTACFVMGVGELSFVLSTVHSELLVALDHLYKLAAYGFICVATFRITIQAPYEQLQRSAQRFESKERDLQSLLKNLPVGIARIDRNFKVLFANLGFFRKLRVPGATIPGQLSDKITTDALIQLLHPSLAEALSGESSEQVCEYTANDGSMKHLHVIIKPDATYAGSDGGVLVTFTDTTECEQNRLHLKASQQENNELKMALDAHAIVATTNARGVITEVNDKFCAISQYAREDLIGQTHKVINSGYHPREFFQDLWRTISRGEVWSGEVCNRAKDGSLYWVQSTIVPFVNENGRPEQYVAIRADITARKEAEADSQRMALHDALTGLPNRRLMTDRLNQAIYDKTRRPCFGAVLLMDLDHFKEVNDTLGHATGDELLKQTALRLASSVRQVDTVARLGGDEFVTILNDIGSDLEGAVANARRIGEAIRIALVEPYQLGSQHWDVTPSIGVALFNSADDNSEELIKRADIALYGAKDAGRNQLCFFDPSLQEEAIHRALLIRDLRQALDNNELTLFYQPIVNEQKEILGFEALIRWFHPKHGPVSPSMFIPLAEQSGLILPIGEWVLKTACSQLAEWGEDLKHEACTVAVNVSARQLNQANFVETIKKVITLTGVRADRLRLELTESMLQDDVDNTIVKMKALRQLGVRFSLDDFGTGYSSLSYLKRLPLDTLKIDKSFVEDIFEDPSDAAIARTVIALAKSLDLDVVAEGVETAEQLEWLLKHGCKLFQGYLFSPPVPKDQLQRMLLNMGV